MELLLGVVEIALSAIGYAIFAALVTIVGILAIGLAILGIFLIVGWFIDS